MKKREYQIPELNIHQQATECLLVVGTTIPVDPGEEGSQADAESKASGDYFEEADNSIRSCEHNPHDYLPKVFNNLWGEE